MAPSDAMKPRSWRASERLKPLAGIRALRVSLPDLTKLFIDILFVEGLRLETVGHLELDWSSRLASSRGRSGEAW